LLKLANLSKDISRMPSGNNSKYITSSMSSSRLPQTHAQAQCPSSSLFVSHPTTLLHQNISSMQNNTNPMSTVSSVVDTKTSPPQE
jgi:hypothetical protein